MEYDDGMDCTERRARVRARKAFETWRARRRLPRSVRVREWDTLSRLCLRLKQLVERGARGLHSEAANRRLGYLYDVVAEALDAIIVDMLADEGGE